MKTFKFKLLSRFVLTLLAIILIFSTQIFLPIGTKAEGSPVIYVSPNGRDNGDGSRALPFATLKKAFSEIDGKVGATVVLMGDAESENALSWNSAYDGIDGHTALITITGKDPVTGEIYQNAHLRYDTPLFEGPLAVEHLILVPARNYAFIDTRGHDFTIGEGVTNKNFDIFIHDGTNALRDSTVVDDTKTTVNSGTINIVYVGGAYADSTENGVTGDCNLIVNGGKINTVIVGFDQYDSKHTKGTIDGNVVVTINGGAINKIDTKMLTNDTIGGAFVIIANNSSSCPQYTPPIAKDGVYVINTGNNGSVFYTGKAGVFGYLCSPKYTCYVDGKRVDGASFEVESGTHAVTFIRERKEDFMNAYINGFPDNTFRPDEKLTRAQAAQIVVNAIGKPVLQDENFVSSFSDIKSSDWYYSAVSYLEKNDVLPSEWQNELLPNENITRGEFLHIVDAMLTKHANSTKLLTFSDVTPESTPYYAAITSAMASGCVIGYEDGSFRPENELTRAEAVTFVNRYLSRTPVSGELSNFSDMKGHWADGQVLAASSGKDENKWDHAKEVEDSAFVIPESADSAADYITALYESSASLSGKAIREGVDKIAERMKSDILNSPNTLDIYGEKVTGTAYHISEKGDDDTADGSVERPFRTIAGLFSKISLRYGDAVLFERSGIYRGTFSVTAGVVYGSYGQGNKPIVMQSKKNYASPDLWQKTEWENVWVCTEKLVNVGVIGFDHDLQDYSENTYNALYGITMNKGLFGFKDVSQLCGDLQFYSELYNGTDNYGELYVYSKDGNPGKRFSSIEIGEKKDIVSGSARDVVLDNISFKFTGAHGMGGAGGAVNRTVTNCIWSWIGGSVLSINYNGNGKPINYGNAVEIYGGCNGYYVENNWMYQIYDTAVTHQKATWNGNCIQENIRYAENLMEYVYWGIEFYNMPPTAAELAGNDDPYKRVTRNVTSEYNLLRLGGYGWGSVVRHRGAELYAGRFLSENYDCTAKYNIFDRAYGNLLVLTEDSNETVDKNIYIQHADQPLGKLRSTAVTNCDYDAARNISQKFGDKNAVVILIDPLEEPAERKIPEGLCAPDAFE